MLRRIYAARGVLCPADADLALGHLLVPDTLGGLDAAIELLCDAIAREQRILVVGDYDADGATGTAVALRGLRLLGAKHLNYRVPHRFIHGYGLTPELVAEIARDAPDLLITVDNGVASHAGVAAARAAGMRVLITDHHLPGESLPVADAIVNPNLPGDGFASKALAGVGVMFYLLIALRATLRARGLAPESAEALSSLLDLVALGTVADLVPLDRNNRVLVAAGLKRIRAGRACPGVAALLDVSQKSAANVTATDLAFFVAPRLNAAGRLDDMGLGIAALLTDDAFEARAIAERLHRINAERRDLQADMVDEAQAIVRGMRLDSGALPLAVSLCEPSWHAGVVGLVASKLRETLHRPVIAFAPAGEGSDELKGSGRSVDGFHLRDALADVHARHPGLIDRFGGHAMAAGLSIRADRFEDFAQAFARRAAEIFGDVPPDAVHWSDGELVSSHATLALAEQLRAAGPWGQAFPEPTFDNVFRVRDWKVMAERHLRLTLVFEPCGSVIEAVFFGGYLGSPPPARVHALYQLTIDDWRGERRLRAMIRHWDAA